MVSYQLIIPKENIFQKRELKGSWFSGELLLKVYLEKPLEGFKQLDTEIYEQGIRFI